MNTKRVLIVLAVITIGCSWSHAQVMRKGMNLAGVGLGVVPGIGVNASYDYGLVDDWGPGIFTIGGYVGFGTWGRAYHIANDHSNYRVNAFAFAPRATYRYAIEPPFEIYGTFLLGAVIKSYSDYFPNDSRAFVGITIGGRYSFKSNASLFAEIGFNEISFLSTGLSFSF